MVELLEDAGAVRYPGPVIHEGGPGMSSSYSLLYADTPNVVIDAALKNLEGRIPVWAKREAVALVS